MKSNILFLLHFLLIVVAGVELAGRFFDNIRMEYWVKPFIMPLMAVIFLVIRKKKNFTFPVLIAFFFSWWGDNFLMLSAKGELWFYAGVGAFFFAQCTYMYIFVRFSEYGGPGLLTKKPFWVLPFMVYLIGMIVILFPGMEGLMRPIIVLYAFTLLSMSALALNRRHRVNLLSFKLVFAGSVLFVLSDSMIALNKFFVAFHLAGFWIMIGYISAQYLIMRGLAEEE